MLRSFTRAELLREWLTRRGYQPLRSDVAADLTTGTDPRPIWVARSPTG